MMDRIPSVLACDVGNGAVHFAHVAGEDVSPLQVMRGGGPSDVAEALANLWQEMPAPKKLVACSVNTPAMKALEAAAKQSLHEPILLIGRDLPQPMEIDLADAGSVGADRLCCAAAAYDRLGVACAVADFGTATTIDCVNDRGVFSGGAILPGLAMGAEALHAHTALLPKVEPVEPDWVFGRDTRQAIIGGLIFGARGALRQIVESYATELGSWPLVIATGGDAELVCGKAGDSQLVQAVVPDLAVRGVAIAYYKTLLPLG